MKILLIGEFSALHNNLKEGLIAEGHDVDIAALGDGWKNIARDIDLDSSKQKYVAALERRINVFTKLWNLKGYDIVQLINPFCLFYFPLLTKKLIKNLKNNNGKLFLVAAGTDSFYLKYARELLRYSPIDDYLKHDLNIKKHKLERKIYFNFNNWLADYVDGIIPIMYDYEVCYSGKSKLLSCISIPMNIEKIKYKKNSVKEKIFVFHGLNRYGFKGTKYVEEAFKILEQRYPDKFEFLIDGKMSLEKYLSVMDEANIIVDQTSSYSNGVNAIYALAMGKIVLGGAEPESLVSLNISSSPVFNIEPTAESIINQIEYLLNNKESIEKLSKESRKYVEKYHDYRDVANLYIKKWT